MRKIIFVVVFLAVALGAYVVWYSYIRQMKIKQVETCNDQLAHPKLPTMTTAPDGSLAPVYAINSCTTIVVPPTLWDLIHGRFVFEDLSPRFTVAIPASLLDILLGNYALQPALVGCDQSATTTNCGTLTSLPQNPSEPPNAVQPIDEWTAATDTPIRFSGFSFVLPPGWHGSVYEEGFVGGLHALVQSDSNDKGFTIDCPPEGKGLEAATRLSTEAREFTLGTKTYLIAIEKWTAPGNEPWYFVWVRAHEPGDVSTDQYGNICLAQGSINPDVETAMKKLYETWK